MERLISNFKFQIKNLIIMLLPLKHLNKRQKRILFSIVILIYIVGTLVLVITLKTAKQTSAAWFNDSWSYRKAVPVATHTSSENNVYINLTGDNDIDTATLVTAGKMQDDCGDLRFTKENGELLPYFIASGCNSADTVVHVFFDTFPSGAQTIYYYYGNPFVANGTETSGFSTEATNYTFGTLGSEETTQGSILYFAFNEGQGTTAYDSTSNRLDGTLNNTPAWQAEDLCIFGKCLFFDGTNNENVSKSDDSNLDFTQTNNFTLGAWIRAGPVAAVKNIITKAGNTGPGYKLYMDASGDLCFDVDSDSTWGTDQYDSACTSAVDFDDNKWHYVTGIKTGTTKIELFVDGILRASDSTIAATNTLVNDGTFYVGIDRDGTTGDFNGFIDEVKVYGYARSEAQLKADLASRGSIKGVSAQIGGTDEKWLSEGLVGYWKMNETSSTTTVTDSSGNGNTGSIDLWGGGNTATSSALLAGKFGTGINFDGVDDRVYIGTNSILNLTQEFTLSAWVKTSESGRYQVILSRWLRDTVSRRQYELAINSSSKVEVNGSSTTASTTSVTDGNWHLITGVFKANDFVNTYVDGVLEKTVDSPAARTPQSDISNLIGAQNKNSSIKEFFFEGTIDEARVYNRALTPSEVERLYNWAPGPVGYWNMEEKTGTVANDTSGNGNSLTLTNSPAWTIGKYGTGVNFAGSDQHLYRDDDADFDFAAGASFTLEGWFKHNTASAQEVILSKYNEAGYKLLMESDGDITCGIDYDGTWSPTDSVTSTAATYDDNKWHHIACTKDANTSLSLYIDGVEVGTTDTSLTDSTLINSDPLYIGVDADGTSNDFIGQIDEVKIYNYARTVKQIVQDMNAGHPAPGSPVGSALAHWSFDEINGSTINDQTAHNNDLFQSNANGFKWADGKFGRAFNGTGSGLEALCLGNTSCIQGFWFDGDNDFSFSLWFRSDSANNPATTEYLVSNIYGTAVAYAIYAETDGDIVLGIEDDTTWNPDDSVGNIGTDFYDGTWHHFVFTVKGNDALKMYVDGVLRDTSAITVTGAIDHSRNFFLGSKQNLDDDDDLNGDLDEMKVYNYTLTEDEVKTEYNFGKSLVLGSLSDTSSLTGGSVASNSASAEYCVPGDTSTCNPIFDEWKFEEKTSTLTYSVGTKKTNLTLADTATTNGDGNTPPKWVSGKIGGALKFDGTDDNAEKSSSVYSFTGAMTISAWIYPEDLSAERYIFAKFTTTRGPRLMVNGSAIAHFGIAPTSSTTLGVSSNSVLSLNKWYHVTGVFEPSTALRIYINGALDNINTSSIPATQNMPSGDTAIGSRSDNIQFFRGIIDEVKVYNYTRTPSQIAWDYNRGKPVVYYKLNECQGTTLNESMGSTASATLTIGGGGEDTVGTCTTSSTAWGGTGGSNAGKFNYAMNFDGTDDYAKTTNLSLLTYNGQTINKVSWGAWVKPTSSAASKTILHKGNEFKLTTDANSKAVCTIYSGSWKTDTIATSNSALPLDSWSHVLCVYDGANVKVYVNGALVNTGSSETGNITSSYNALSIARDSDGTGFFQGMIDEVKIYNYNLNSSLAKNEYNQRAAIRFGPNEGSP